MPSVFTRIINGELPGRFVWRDDRCVGFLSINPLGAGHTLVVPRVEIDHWIDLDDETAAHLMHVARIVGQAQQQVFQPAKVGLIIAGYEVPHVHLHVIPTQTMDDFDFRRAAKTIDPDTEDRHAERLREELRALGRTEVPSPD